MKRFSVVPPDGQKDRYFVHSMCSVHIVMKGCAELAIQYVHLGIGFRVYVTKSMRKGQTDLPEYAASMKQMWCILPE